METNDAKGVEAKLRENFDVSEADFKLLNEGLKLNVKLRNGSTANDLLSHLTKEGIVQHFVEVVPDANDIFIQAVNQNS